MPGWTDATEAALLDGFTGKTTYTAPTWYIGASTTTPTETGGNFTEPSGNGYARVQLTAGTWNAATGGDFSSTSYGSTITFPQASASWGRILSLGMFTHATAGDLHGWTTTTVDVTIGAGDRLTVPLFRVELGDAPDWASFSPDDISGLMGWYDASDTATITHSSGSVSQWDDKSGNANHLTQGTGAQQPITGTRTQNSLNVIDFSSGNMNLVAGSNFMSGKTAGTVFIVKLNDVNTISGSGVGPWQIGGGEDSWQPFIDDNIYEWFGTDTCKNWATTASTLLSPYMYGVVAASGDFRAYVNGVQDHSTGTNTVAFTAAIKLGINGSGGRWHDGWVAEWIIYDSALSTANREAVEDYLTAKWGL